MRSDIPSEGLQRHFDRLCDTRTMTLPRTSLSLCLPFLMNRSSETCRDQPFRALADPTAVRRALLAQMRYVANVATSLPHDVYSTARV